MHSSEEENLNTDSSKANLINIPHHQQLQLCTTRPAYRQGRKLTAVKVYTINSESQHLFIYGVPKINLRNELKTLCNKYGQLKCLHVVSEHETEIFTECFHAQYDRIQSARIAKRLLDNKSFYGGVLHVCYAPEYETLEETKAKLLQRTTDVLTRLPNATGTSEVEAKSIYNQTNRKRKCPAIPLTEERLQGVNNPNEIWNGIPSELDPRTAKQPKLLSSTTSHVKKHYQMDVPKAVPKVYGPQLPTRNDTDKEKMPAPSLMPSNIMKTNKINVVKRIVFKKK